MNFSLIRRCLFVIIMDYSVIVQRQPILLQW
jgi:hypothetical protein